MDAIHVRKTERFRFAFVFLVVLCSMILTVSLFGSSARAVTSSDAPPAICVDSPTDNATQNGDFAISGWAVSKAGISRVDFYYDNFTWLGSTSNMYVRGDVNSIINASGVYSDALHSGFSYTVSKSTLSVGTHTIYIAAISRDGSVQWAVRTVVIGPASQMCIDSPSNGLTTNGNFAISGWSVSKAGLSRVDIYVDNFRYLGSSSSVTARYDVNCVINAGGQYSDAVHCGFSYLVSPSQLTEGVHTIYVAAISKDGTVQWDSRTITIGPTSQMCLDNLSDGATLGDSATITGWTVSHAGVVRVDFYIDNFSWLGSTGMTQRADVNSIINASGQYTNALNSGFSYTFSTDGLTTGTHTIYIAAISSDGSVKWASRTVMIGADPQMNLDSPGTTGYVSTSSVTVSGWSVSRKGLSRVDFYIDNMQWLGSTSTLITRADVNTALNGNGQYTDALHSGFSFTFDSSSLSQGTHTIYAAAISRDGSVQWYVRSINVIKAAVGGTYYQSMEDEILALVNSYRTAAGLSALTTNATISSWADMRATEIAALGSTYGIAYISHTRLDGTNPWTGYPLTYTWVGENIAAGQTTATQVVTAWMNSPGHYANIMRASFGQIGISCYYYAGRYYWVQFFTS